MRKTEEGKKVNTDVKGLKAMASRLKSAVTSVVGELTGRKYYELKPSVRDSSKLAEDILTVVKILRELAKADANAFVDGGRLFHATEFSPQARNAVFNARLLASGRKVVR